MFKSATFKLTLWYLALVMVISLVFSLVVYRFATGELSTGLHLQTERIFRTYPVFNADPNLVQRPDYDVQVGEHHIIWRLFYFNLLVLVAAGFASYFLARRTLEPIEAAHERQKRFTADVSHELRTPLTSLKMGSEVALMDAKAKASDLRQALTSNLDDASKMEKLINNLLYLSKLDDNQAFSLQKTDLGNVLVTAVQQLQHAAEAKQIVIHPPTNVKLHVNGDAESLTQLFVILLDNAIKYSPADEGITINAHQKDGHALVSIADHGQGISPQALPHVFDRFYRQDSARHTAQTNGYGLGLSIAKLIADGHQGNIRLTSQPGKGTTATVQLPLFTATPSQTPKPATPRQ